MIAGDGDGGDWTVVVVVGSRNCLAVTLPHRSEMMSGVRSSDRQIETKKDLKNREFGRKK